MTEPRILVSKARAIGTRTLTVQVMQMTAAGELRIVQEWAPDRPSRLSHAEHEAVREARDEAVRAFAVSLDQAEGMKGAMREKSLAIDDTLRPACLYRESVRGIPMKNIASAKGLRSGEKTSSSP
jgi:hypothetical protein